MASNSTTYRSDRLDHANHNLEVAKHLFNNGDSIFPDWVITACFYSAIHFVKYKVFPIPYDKKGKFKLLQTFEDYLIEEGIEKEKHGALAKLVREYCKPVRSEYEQLFDMCMGARYESYKVSPKAALTAMSSIMSIKAYCCPAGLNL